MLDEQPDGDPHGECAAEIHRLQAEASALRDALETVVRQCGDKLTQASGNTALLPHIRALLAEEISLGANLASTLNRDREADRERFTDPAFNRWLDEGITDAGHTVWDQIGSVVDAWAGWSNRPWYTEFPPGADDTNGVPVASSTAVERR